MTTLSFQVGDVVKINPDEICFERDWSLRDRLGEVVGVDPSRGAYCVQVNLGINFRSKHFYERLTNGVGWFIPSELEIQDGWTLLTRADFMFSHSVTSIVPLKKPWTPENRCMHEDHAEENAPVAVRRAMVNVWGTVQEIDVCEEHLDQDGRCADDIPYRKTAETAVSKTHLHPSLLRLALS